MDGRSEFDRWFGRPATLVLQPTTLCNLDCSYCYLPFRRLNHEMPLEVATAVATSAAQLTENGGPLGIVWHGGEPLALGRPKLTDLLAPFEGLLEAGRIRHYIQTNATLLDDQWCELLIRHDFRVGVSIDGPTALNARRVDLRGLPIFDRILRGIELLRAHGIPFSVIAVVGAEGVTAPEALLNFLASLGPHTIGLNVEEMEGVNRSTVPITQEQAERFWVRVFDWSRHRNGVPVVREMERLAEYLHLVHSGHRDSWDNRRLDPIPTVSCDGDVVLLSPELADTVDAAYGNFLAGNIRQQTISTMLAQAHRLLYVQEFMVGLSRCQAECDFWNFCRGAQAGNRYFENGSLSTMETAYCRLTRQALITALSTSASVE
ncbi:cyclophane-forming radical SAM peptide maturase AmcB [Rhizohabitans arisaemae]|uniref:cyclophane-forming radical SAM peptide maturase AmcB n=1 Tax=Rhizohabitans arisaemae TaxID=2720610 RepID=UPI0024B249BF|nr:cyclophane-forming radical SAM peptide maturase AmcB [Rhizohabitans arisaemae]